MFFLSKISKLSWLFICCFTLTYVNASDKVLLIVYGDLLIPIIAPSNPPPTPTPPSITKASLTSTPPSQTSKSFVSVEVKGQANKKVYINGQYYGTLNSLGVLTVVLDTSGADGAKSFSIVLKDNAGNSSQGLSFSIEKITDSKFALNYQGLAFYEENNLIENYHLTALTDSKFNSLNQNQKELIANKLLTTLFFNYPHKILQEKIATGVFIQNLLNDILEERMDKAWLESRLIDNDIFIQRPYNEQEAVNILARFYLMNDLDLYYFENWMAYILTQTIMFSPAYELESSHAPNIARVYNRLVRMISDEHGLRYITYIHMMSDDNWRRFRSPEDNGREMLEIFAFDKNDSHVPLAGKALQNWKLDPNNDTLVIGLNENTEAVSLFNTSIYTGEDFYRELSKSTFLIESVVKRLVFFFFPTSTGSKRATISQAIVQSNPKTWKDILLQIVLSEEYLLHTQRPKSAEELFFSVAKKMDFKHRDSTFYSFKSKLEDMHQASMKYKLGKLNRVPLDSLSFANYHQYIREEVFLRQSNPLYETVYTAWSRQGWSQSFIDNSQFTFDENNGESSLISLIQYLFHAMTSRAATSDELALFKGHMMTFTNNTWTLRYKFNMIRVYASDLTRQAELRENAKRNISIIVLDYLSRLSETYMYGKVN